MLDAFRRPSVAGLAPGRSFQGLPTLKARHSGTRLFAHIWGEYGAI